MIKGRGIFSEVLKWDSMRDRGGRVHRLIKTLPSSLTDKASDKWMGSSWDEGEIRLWQGKETSFVDDDNRYSGTPRVKFRSESKWEAIDVLRLRNSHFNYSAVDPNSCRPNSFSRRSTTSPLKHAVHYNLITMDSCYPGEWKGDDNINCLDYQAIPETNFCPIFIAPIYSYTWEAPFFAPVSRFLSTFALFCI